MQKKVIELFQKLNLVNQDKEENLIAPFDYSKEPRVKMDVFTEQQANQAESSNKEEKEQANHWL